MSIVRQPDPKGIEAHSLEDGAEPALVWPRGENERHAEAPGAAAGERGRRLWVLTKPQPDAVDEREIDLEEENEAGAFAEEPSDPLAAFVSEAEMSGEAAEPPPRRWTLARWLAVGFAAVAFVEAAMLLGVFRVPERLISRQGTLRVVTAEPGARVMVDGVDRGAAPLALALAAGAHKIEVRQGDRARAFDADVRAGAESAHYVDLSPAGPDAGVSPPAPAAAVASIEITSDPPGGRVTIDGALHGVTPLQLGNLAPGAHEVRVANENGTVTRQVRLTAGVNAALIVTMPRPKAVTPGWVRIRLPVTAQIYQGESLIGTTDVDRLMLPAGRHTLRLVNRDLAFSTEQTVTIAAGQTSVVNVPLPNGLLNVNALPWAQVWVDGEMKGDTPIGRLSLPIGVHEIVLRHPELGERRRSVTVTQGAVTRVGVDLRQQ